MQEVTEVYRPDTRDFELRPFLDRVLEIVGLFERGTVVRLRIAGTIAAGEPIEAIPELETVELRGPTESARCHRVLHGLRRHLCPALRSVSGDAFEIARVATPILAGLRVAGKLDVDLDPWLFAGVSLLLARMGVATFCADDEDDEGGAAEDGGDRGAAATASAEVRQPLSEIGRRGTSRRGQPEKGGHRHEHGR